MAKLSKIKLSVPNPCKEDWDKMKLTDKGRFCERCSNIITDFSVFTDKELVEYLSKVKGKVCGQFANTQLNRMITVQEPSTTPLFRKLLFSTALAAGVAGAAHSQSTQPNRNGANASGNINMAQTPMQAKQATKDSTTILKGKVVNLKDDKPVANASIVVQYDSVNTDAVITDSNGRFSFHVPDKYIDTKITLITAIYGYAERTTFYEIKRKNKTVYIKLRKNKASDMGKTVGRMM